MTIAEKFKSLFAEAIVTEDDDLKTPEFFNLAIKLAENKVKNIYQGETFYVFTFKDYSKLAALVKLDTFMVQCEVVE